MAEESKIEGNDLNSKNEELDPNNIDQTVNNGTKDESESATKVDDSSITMLDVLEAEREMEDEYAAVLGASDEKCCTYSKGAVKRQALYSCLTCCPEARQDLTKCAGICLACSYYCHENHELVELYTKRNFRCDCPTKRMARDDGNQNICRLNADLHKPAEANDNNSYNQNFQGLYCNCHRPYPDPERNTEENLMIQCAICEDWYHLEHIDAPNGASVLLDNCTEIICNSCMESKAFLKDYIYLSLTKVTEDSEKEDVIVHIEKTEDNKLKSDLDKSISEIMKMTDGNKVEEQLEDNSEPVKKRSKTNPDISSVDAKEESVSIAIKCSRPHTNNSRKSIKGPTFWTNDWRSQLCRCDRCLSMYRKEQVEYLLDPDDSSQSYEERGIRRAANECSTYEQGIKELANIGHTQRIDAITAYNDMKDRLKEFLHSFVVNKKVVTEEDINGFFTKMRNEKKAQRISAQNPPHFCR